MIKIKELQNIEGFISLENIDLEIEVTSFEIDSRKCVASSGYFALKGRNADGHDYISSAISNGCVLAVVDKNYDNKDNFPVLRVTDVELSMGEIAKIWRDNSSAVIVAITGSNGKTTSKNLINSVLSEEKKVIATEKNYNNQQGVPLTIFRIKKDTEVAVVELGTNAPGEIEYLANIVRPDIAVITNIGLSHVEKLIDKEGVYKEKSSLAKVCNDRDGVIIYKKDDEYLKRYENEYKNIFSYGIETSADLVATDIENCCKGVVFNVDSTNYHINLEGKYNVYNALAAICVAKQLNIKSENIFSGLEKYMPENMRGQAVVHKTTKYIIDCYNANPDSMESVINEFSSPDTIFVLGDMLELGDKSIEYHREICQKLMKLKYDRVLLVGDNFMECMSLDPERFYFSTTSEFAKEVLDVFYLENRTVVVKGSRGIGLEKVLNDDVRKYIK